MKITSYFTKALLFAFALASFSSIEMLAAEPKPKKLSKSDVELINYLEEIQRSLSRKLTALKAIKTTALSTPELSERDTQAYNYGVWIRNELLKRPVIEHALMHEIFHTDNHIKNINTELDLIQTNNPDDRAMYVRLYQWSVPVMFNLLRDLTIKAIKVIKFGTLRQASSGG